MAQLEVLRVHKVALEMLENFLKACEVLKLKYFVYGGTLLGAVRHGGFIPWDDDVDVALPREDYERFMQAGQRELKDCYFLQNYVTDPQYTRNYAKIRDSRTTFIETAARNRKINHGAYMDVYPLDGVPDNRMKRRLDKFRLTMLQIETDRYHYHNGDGMGRNSVKGKVAAGLSNIATLGMSLRTVQRKIDSVIMSTRYASSRQVANYLSLHGERTIVPRDYLGEGVPLQFEHLNVIAPSRYDLYLTSLYSDYMRLPPEEERRPHHDVDEVDLDVPFAHYRGGEQVNGVRYAEHGGFCDL